MVRHHTRKVRRIYHRAKTLQYHGHAIPGELPDVTFHGLHKWYTNMYEKLGWMVLAKSYGMSDKTESYINSLYRLKMTIEKKLKTHRIKDHKDDLKILLKNLEVLIKHAERDIM